MKLSWLLDLVERQYTKNKGDDGSMVDRSKLVLSFISMNLGK